MHAFQSQQSFEQEELEALTLQLLKVKQLLLDHQQLLAQEKSTRAGLENQLQQLICQESSTRTSLEEQLQQLINQESSRRIALENQQQQLQAALESANQRQTSLEQRLWQLQTQQTQKNEKIESLSTQIIAHESDKLKLNDALTKTRQALEDREGELKTAQQHLARKVREIAHLQEQLKEEEQRIQALQAEAGNRGLHVEALKNEISRGKSRETQLLEQLNIQTSTAQGQQAKLQADYASAVKRCEEAETQLQRLRLIETQHLQLRALLVKLEHPMPSLELDPEKPVDTQPVRMRQNLFDD